MQLRIKELREEYGMTQRELAERINNAQRNVSNWEKGVSEPDCETIVKLADIFETSIDELFGRQERYGVKDSGDAALISLIHKLDKNQVLALKQFLLSFN